MKNTLTNKLIHIPGTDSEIAHGKTIKDNAPNWFKKAIKERVESGSTVSEAILAVQRSPFFKKEWVN